MVYSDTAHSLGGATDTGVAKVTTLIAGSPPAVTDERDHTGTDRAGGGGMDGDAKAIVSVTHNNNKEKQKNGNAAGSLGGEDGSDAKVRSGRWRISGMYGVALR